jgi:hypothetical protein
MNRIEFIEDYREKRQTADNSVLYALIRCLDATEVVGLLQKSVIDNPPLTNASLKIVAERCAESWTEIYDDLIADMIEAFPTLSPNRRGSAFHCLGELGGYAPSASRTRILDFLLTSRYAAGRRKGLSMLRVSEVAEFADRVVNCAFAHHESKAALLMIQHFAPEYLYEKRVDILRILDANWAVAKLYMKAAQYEPACVEELRAIDVITFAYTSAKLNQLLPDEDVTVLVDECRLDQRLGLLIWAIGKMKHWDILVHIAEHYDTWQMERILDSAHGNTG